MNERGAHVGHRILLIALGASAAISGLLAARGAFLSCGAPGEGRVRDAIEPTFGMARLPYVDDPTPRRGCRPAPAGWSRAEGAADAAAAFAELRALGRPPLNLYRILANQPRALRAFLGMSRYIRDENPLPARLRELVILTTAFALGARYEQVHHLESARRAGVPEAQLAAFPAWQSSGAFDAVECAAMTYAHELATSRRAGAATFEALRTHFQPPQIVDLTLTCGWYHLVGAVLLGLEVDVEA